MTDITYTATIEELAETVITSTLGGYSGRHTHALAQEIQLAIDNYLAGLEDDEPEPSP